MKLDEALFTATEVARLAQTDIVNVHTWTTRGFADPYHAKPRVRRGRGKPRSYSVRDALRFFLMARLHEQYRTPLPRGLEICQAVFGEESFNPDAAVYLVVEDARSLDLQSYRDLKSLEPRLAGGPVTMVLNVKLILDQISAKALRLQTEAG